MGTDDEHEPLVFERTSTVKRVTYGSDGESELVALLRGEYVCRRKDTLIRLGRRENNLVGIFLRPDPHDNEAKSLYDIKETILKLLDAEDPVGDVHPLHLIVGLHSPGQLGILELLCSRRDPNVVDSKSMTPLHHALSWSNLQFHASRGPEEPRTLIDIVACLLKSSVDVNAKDFEGSTPLHYLLNNDSAGDIAELGTVLDLLLKAGADANLPEPGESISPLGLACCLGGPFSLDAMKLLVDSTNIHSQDVFSQTPIFHVFRGKPYSDDFVVEKLRFLLDRGAEVNTVDSGRSPLLYVVGYSEETWVLPVLKVLLEHGADIKARDSYSGRTALHYVCSYFHGTQLREMVEVFIEAGADLNEPDNTSSTPFHHYCQNPKSSPEMFKYFVDIGADLRKVDQSGNGPIHMMGLCELYQQVETLVELGCDINAKNIDGLTPIYLFLHNYCEFEAVRTLVESGADCSVSHDLEGYPLHVVSTLLLYQPNVWDSVGALLSGGADINCRDSQGNTPLHLAVQFRIRDCADSAVENFIRLGADVNVQNALGDTPLHFACRLDKLPVQLAEILLLRGALVNQTNAKGETPLHAAQSSRERSCLTKLLLQHNANLWALDHSNVTPLARMSSKMANYVIRYAALLAADKPNLQTKLNSNYKQFEQYLTTAKAMKAHTLGNTSFTLLRFLLTSNYLASRHLENPTVLSDVRTSIKDEKYSPYSSYINHKLSEVTTSKEMFKLTVDSLNSITSPLRFADTVVDMILFKLSAKDMNSLNRAVHYLNV